MSHLRLLSTLFILLFSLGIVFNASAKDNKESIKTYEFNFRGFVSKKINNEVDYALLKGAEFALKKKHNYFIILETRKFDATNEYADQRSSKFGRSKPKRVRDRTEVVIKCFNEDPAIEGSYNARDTKKEIKEKYSD